jgi:DNA-directed DNA polymerase III PolC
MSDFFDNFTKVKIPYHGVRLPTVTIETEDKLKIGAKADCDNLEFLTQLCRNGFKEKIQKKIPKEKHAEYAERVKYELSVFKELGFIDYVLLVWDVNNFAIKKDIARGYGRGSVCGSLVFFLIEVTQIDPIEHELYFARFITKIRAKKTVVDGITYVDGGLMPDVDSDYCYYRRPEIIGYLQEKYKGRVSKLMNMQTLTGKILIKDCLKIIDESTEEEAKEASALLEEKYGVVEEIADAMQNNEAFKAWAVNHKESVEVAMKLAGLVRSTGQHASAVLVSFDPIEDLIPLEISKDKEPISAYDMYSASYFCVKLDILGLKTASVLYEACKAAGLNMFDIDVKNPEIYDTLRNPELNSYGLFQIESYAQGNVTRKIKTRNLNELSASLAISRPGAMSFLDQFCDYTQKGLYKEIHPVIDSILKPTGGVAIFQEQLLAMLNAIGMDLEECELVRRVVGKKDVEKMPKYKSKIYELCDKNGHPRTVGDFIWKIAEDSANYSFNKSHTAAYASMCAATVYIKYKYPQYFILALLRMAINDPKPQESIAEIYKEIGTFNIRLLPPHLLKSSIDFELEGTDIRFGLRGIKGIADSTIEKLKIFKKEHANKFELFESASNAGLSIGVLGALIQAGALDGYGVSRPRLVLEAQFWNLLKEKERLLCIQRGAANNYDPLKIISDIVKNKDLDEKKKPLIKDSRFETIKKHYQPYKAIYLQNHKNEKFASWYYETSLLGYSYSYTLMDIFSEHCKDLRSLKEISTEVADIKVRGVAIVTEYYAGVSKKSGKKFVNYEVRDETKSYRLKMFGQWIDQCNEMNNGMPKEESIIIFNGKTKDKCVFVDTLSIQDHKIFMKLRDVKDKEKNVDENPDKPKKKKEQLDACQKAGLELIKTT